MNYLKSSIVVLALGLMACGGGNTENTALDALTAQLTMLEDTIKTSEGMAWAQSNWEEIEGNFEGNWENAEEVAKAAGTDLSEYKTRFDAVATTVKENMESGETEGQELDSNGNVIGANMEDGSEVTGGAPTVNVSAAYTALGIDYTDTEFATITKENILAAYQGFVSTVKNNYNKYDAEDAKVISDMWDKLNDRKEAVEPIATKDNLKIAALKTEFAAVKTGLKARTSFKKTEEKVEDKIEEKKN